jgi:hypothetical protein
MVTIDAFRKFSLSLGEVSELPHFEKTSFRVNKRIFATLSETNHVACIKLSEMEQSVFCAFDKTIIYPVPNKWGNQGWTNIDLQKIRKDMLIDALTVAFNEVSRKAVKKIK